MSWKTHVNNTVQKATRCLFIILQLKRCGTKLRILWQVYFALVRSILTYAYPAVCNMPNKSFTRLTAIERRAEKIIGCPPPIDMSKFCNDLCVQLSHNVSKCSSHPLRTLMSVQRENTQRLRHRPSSSLPAVAKTTRLHQSFIRFL